MKLLCEEDDTETIEAIRALDLPPHYHLLVVPDSQPKTKPRPATYGLQHARGEFCVIYDGEDRPDPDQLKKAVAAFRKAPDEVACIQAKLNYFNRDQNLLTRWFSIEYAMTSTRAPRPGPGAGPDPARRHLEPLRHRPVCASSEPGTRST